MRAEAKGKEAGGSGAFPGDMAAAESREEGERQDEAEEDEVEVGGWRHRDAFAGRSPDVERR